MVYCLFHENIISNAGQPVEIDTKVLGHYSSIEKVLHAKEHYMSVQGFSDFQYGFHIEVIDSHDQENLGVEKTNKIYRNCFSHFSDTDVTCETFFDGYFLSENAARKELEEIRNLPRFSACRTEVDVVEINVDEAQWLEGFVTT